MITDSFDARTLANMEVALESACKRLDAGEQHLARKQIASRILDCAQNGGRTLGELTRAAMEAADTLMPELLRSKQH